MLLSRSLKIGYINGEPSRLNEKVVDGQWIGYLNEYVELVKIPPVALIKLFGGGIQHWHDHYPASLNHFAEGLAQLCEKYGITILYLNIPFMIPYLLLARNQKNLDLKVLFFAHSVASEFWLKLWIAVAPLIKPSDILLCPSQSSKTAMVNISDRYQHGYCLPHCIRLDKPGMPGKNQKHLDILAIGRIEDVKNIDLVIRCFKAIKSRLNHVKLTIAGEYTGKNQTQIQNYQRRIDELIREYQLGSSVRLTGPILGLEKKCCFHEADLLINLSTDPGETFGYNLIEAKIWGLPVVCTRWDGFREVVEESVDGMMIDCRWDGQMPEIDYQQAVDTCIRLLTDEPYREKLGAGALRNAIKYDYQRIIPQIVEIMAHPPEESALADEYPDNSVEIVRNPISKLSGIYHLSKLQSFKFQDETPLSVLLQDYQDSLADWMAKVKPIIRHFA